MKLTSFSTAGAVAASVVLVAACGGGGDDEAGSLTTFSVVPSSITATGPTGACAVGASSEVFVYGGAAPYRIDNTVPGYVSVNKTQVDQRGGSFTVTFSGGCLAPGQIVVVDKLDRQVTLTLNNVKGA